MKLSEFDYHLPPELIAETPAAKRENSRLFVLPGSNPAQHKQFYEIADELK
jgi:S-adenosylmethionine:tRNA ribosyltransferase-isomerase